MKLGGGIRRVPVPHCLGPAPRSFCCRVGAETQTTALNNNFLAEVSSAVCRPTGFVLFFTIFTICRSHSSRSPHTRYHRCVILVLDSKVLLYKTIIKPIWTNGIELWGCASKSSITIIQRSQCKILRMKTNAPWCYQPDSALGVEYFLHHRSYPGEK
jgi:hypothetical protein